MTKILEFNSVLIVNRNTGIQGTDDDYYVESEDEIAVEVTLHIPESLFDPVRVNITVPEDFLALQPIESEVESVEVPVIINDKKGEIKIVDDVVKANKVTNILALLKRAIFRQD